MNKILALGTITLRIGVWALIVLLPTARSFSVGNYRARARQQYQPLKHGVSSPYSNTLNNDINTNINIKTSPTRIGSTRQPLYQNNDISFRDQSQFDDESLDDAYYREEFSSLLMDTNRRFESSMEYGWRGLKEMYSSPSAVAITVANSDGGGNDGFIFPNEVSVLQSERSRLTPSSSSPTPLDLEEVEFPHPGLTSSSRVSSPSPSPLILRPKYDHQSSSSPEFLRTFLKNNRQWIEQRILESGTVVFRGFGLESETIDPDKGSVDETVRAFDPDYNIRASSSSSFDSRNGFEYYFISNTGGREDYPSSVTTLYSDLNCTASSRKQLKEIGREKRLVDFRKIYRYLPSKLRTKLINKKLRYRRTHRTLATETLASKFGGKKTIDDTDRASSWFQLFGTTNKRHVERMCEKINTNILRDIYESSIFVSEFLSEPFQLHPKTQERIWFRHAHVFHWTVFPAELFANFRRTKNVRILGRALRVGAQSFWKYGIRRQRTTPVEVTFGDGTPISIWEMHQIRNAIQHSTVHSRWQQGDLLIVDGLSMGLQHNRREI